MKTPQQLAVEEIRRRRDQLEALRRLVEAQDRLIATMGRWVASWPVQAELLEAARRRGEEVDEERAAAVACGALAPLSPSGRG